MKKQISLFVLSAAALIGISGCNQADNSTPPSSSDATTSSESFSSSNSEETTSSESESQVIDTRVELKIDAPDGVDVDVENASADNKYEAGVTLTFTVTATTDYPDNKAITGVTVNGYPATSKGSAGEYVFVMPSEGATIKVTEKTIGDLSVKSVKDIDSSKIPTLAKEDYGDKDKVTAFATEIGEILKAGDATHEKLFRGASFSILNSPISTSVYELQNTFGFSGSVYKGQGTIHASDSVMKLELTGITGEGNSTYKYSAENGYADEDKTLYYNSKAWVGQNSSGEGTDTDPNEMRLYHVVSDDIADEDMNSSTMVTESTAKSKVASFALGKLFASEVFSDGYNAGLTKTDYSSGDLVREITDVETKVAEDNKSYTMDITAFELKNLDANMFYKYVYTYTIDGDGFVSKLAIHKFKYTNQAYWDSENKKLTDDAVADSDSYTDFDLERGYKYGDDEVPHMNVADYKMTDYDVCVSGTSSWAGSYNVSTADLKDGKVLTLEVGSDIKGFTFTDFSSEKGVLLPSFKGTSDADYLTENTEWGSNPYTVKKEGETTLLFDNWFGDVKEVPVKFVNPAPYKIEATLDNTTVMVGESITLKASVVPDKADQNISVTLPDDDPTESTIKDNGEGVYTITPTKAGSSSVTVASTVKPEVTKTLKFMVAGPATLDGVKSFVPTVTFVNRTADKGSFGWDNVNVNFNSDGSGSFVAYYSSYKDGYGEFTWTIDEETLDVNITQSTDASDAYNITLKKLVPVNSAAFQLVFDRGSDDITVNVDGGDRVADLSKGPWVSPIQ